jgi:hypothetical protein
MQLHVLAQNNKFSANIGLSYAPSLCSDGMGDFKGIKASYTPLIDLSFGIEDMQFYIKSGERFELGFRSSSKYIFGGLGYVYDYNAIPNLKNSVFIEIGFPFQISKRVKILLSSRHGVTIKESLYFVSPINATLFFKLTK